CRNSMDGDPLCEKGVPFLVRQKPTANSPPCYYISMPNKRIAVVPGDGIGKEVIPAALKVIEATGAAIEFTTFDWSADRYLKDGTTIPADGFAMLERDFDAIF